MDLPQPDRDHNLHYLINLLNDASDFSFDNAKACHAVVLTSMEHDKVAWQETDKLDRFRRQHAQQHPALNQIVERLGHLLQELGLEVSHHKTVAPSTQVICLGILVDTTKYTLSIPKNKLMEIKKIIALWQHKKYCSKTQLQSLLGSLLYITECVRYSRFFLNMILHTLRIYSARNPTL